MRSLDPAAADNIAIEIVMAWPDHVIAQELVVAQGTTLGDLKIDPRLTPEIRAAWAQAAGVGIFGQKVPTRTVLQPGDRVELWRPLQADPKEARRLRARLKSRSV